MLRKIFALLFVLGMLFAVACSGGGDDEKSSNTTTTTTQRKATTTTVVRRTTTTTSTTTTPTTTMVTSPTSQTPPSTQVDCLAVTGGWNNKPKESGENRDPIPVPLHQFVADRQPCFDQLTFELNGGSSPANFFADYREGHSDLELRIFAPSTIPHGVLYTSSGLQGLRRIFKVETTEGESHFTRFVISVIEDRPYTVTQETSSTGRPVIVVRVAH